MRWFIVFPFILLPILCSCTAISPWKQAPASPEKPWEHQATAALATDLQKRTAPAKEMPLPESGKRYSLSDLIDLAQRRNRTTRTAWETARVAASGAGLSAAEFYPMLAVMASYGGGFWDLDVRTNNNLSGLKNQTGLLGALFSNQIPSDIALNQQASGAYRALNTGAALRWMLFDFGTRQARHEAAKKSLLAANLAFNAAHQTVAFEVTQAYYALQAARRQKEAAETAASSASEVLTATEARFQQGLLTEPPLLQARQAKAQAAYALTSAQAHQELAWIDLAAAIGLPPSEHISLAPADFAGLRKQLQKPLDDYIKSALDKRPDLLAKVAIVQAKEAELRAMRADRLPKLALTGIMDYTKFDTSIQNTGPLDAIGLGLQNYGGFLTIQWPVFTGFAEENKIKAALASKNVAAEEMALAKERTISEVWRAYTRAKNALARSEAAEALRTATHSTYESLLAGFKQGLVPVQEVLIARAAEAQALALCAESDQAIAASLATLAFGSGNIIKTETKNP